MTPDNPIKMDISAKINADFNPLIKATPKGVGRIFSYFFANREAENLRNAILMAAKTQVEYEMILSGEYSYENGKIVPSPYFALREGVTPLQIESRKELQNLAGNVRMAVEALRDVPDKEIPDKSVDDDFFARWRREAKVIGNEELQRLWGRLLAEEIKEPETVSFRVLDILRNISSAEAKIFQQMTPYICDSNFIVTDFVNNHLQNGFPFESYLKLMDCGLVLNVDESIHWYSTDLIYILGTKYTEINLKDIVMAVDSPKEEVTIPGMALSSAGMVASKICDHVTQDKNTAKYIFESIKNHPSNEIKKIIYYRENQNSNYDYEVPLYDSSRDFT